MLNINVRLDTEDKDGAIAELKMLLFNWMGESKKVSFVRISEISKFDRDKKVNEQKID